MKNSWYSFFSDESGAVTVDWVALTAAIVVLGLLIIATIGGAAQSSANWLQETMLGMM